MIRRNSPHSSAQLSTVNRAITGLFAAGVTFVFSYTLVRAALGPAQQAIVEGTNTAIVVPHEATLWADFAGK
jgi:hypothetical protein